MMNNMRHNQANYLHHHQQQQQQQQQQLHHHQHQLQQHHQMQRQTAGLNQHVQQRPTASNQHQHHPHPHPHGVVNRPSRSTQPQQSHQMSHHQQQPVRSTSTHNGPHQGQAMAPPRQPQQQQAARSQSQQAQQTAGQVQQQQQQQPQQPTPAPLPNPLPKGWKREEVVRTRGICAGLRDVVYTASEKAEPQLAGRRLKSKLELQRYFGDRYDMSLLDYRTGKLAQVVYKKQRRLKSIATGNAATNYTLAAKYDMYLNMPNRQTVSIFKQPVHYVTNNQKYNEPTPAYVKDYQPNSAQSMAAVMAAAANNSLTQHQLNLLVRKIDKPRPVQIFWEMRYSNLQHVDAMYRELNLKYDFDLVNLSKFKNLNISNESALRSVAVSWYLNPNKLLVGQDREFIKNPRVFIDRDQPLIPNLVVKEDDIKQQESKVKELREKIKQALNELASMESEPSSCQADEEGELAVENDQAAVSEQNTTSTECKPEIKDELKIDEEKPVQEQPVQDQQQVDSTETNNKKDDAEAEKPNEDVQMNEEPVKNESANVDMEVEAAASSSKLAETETETEPKPKSPAAVELEEPVNTTKTPTITDEAETNETKSNEEEQKKEEEKPQCEDKKDQEKNEREQTTENASTEAKS